MFLTKSEISKQAKVEINIETLQSSCGICKLDKNCLSPKMEVSGLGGKKILVIGDTPSQADDRNKIQFSGDTGKYLSDLLYRNGIHLQKDCWKVNAVRCNNNLKELNKPANLCSGYIKNLLHTLNPEYVIVLGSAGIASIFGEDFSNREVERWRGFSFFYYHYNTNFFCTYHPREVTANNKDFLLKSLFERDIKKACLISKSIIKFKPIDYESKVEHLLTFKKVTDILKAVLRTKKRIYFDYETSGLKPFRKGHFIASIAFSVTSQKAYAFPFQFNNFWTEKQFKIIKDLWCQILLDPAIKKMAHNLKFEEVFSSEILGTPVIGWEWDTMLAAHVLDNRSEWSGLKFQTFINFGVRPYDKYIEEFINSRGKEFNTIHKAPLKELLTYNGLDCIFGFKLAEKQKATIANHPGLINANSLLFQGTLTMSRIQRNGILMDEPYYEKKKKQLTFKIKNLRRELTNGREAKKFRNMFGRPINLASGPDLGKLFYEVLGKDPVYTGNVNVKGEQNYKTDAKTLEKLNLPYVEKLIQMKKLIKARDTYLAQFAREICNGIMYPFFDLHIPVTYRSSCIAGYEKVLVMKDFESSPEGIPIKDIKVGDMIYCFDDDLNPQIKPVLWKGKTGHREIIRVHYYRKGGHGHFDCTPEHPVRLINGEYIEAQNLKKGDRTLACSRKGDKLNFTGHLLSGSGIQEHRLIYDRLIETIDDNDIIHHKDKNHLNHTPTNLEKHTKSSHSKLHVKDTLCSKQSRMNNVKAVKEGWKNGNYKNSVKYGVDHFSYLGLTKFRCLRILADSCGVIKIAANSYGVDFDKFKKYLIKHSIDWKTIKLRYDKNGQYISKHRLIELSKLGRKEVKNILGHNHYKLIELYNFYGIDTKREWANQYGEFKPGNHIITGVEFLGVKEDVYDITVEDHHNFFVNEICVHNSSKPNFQNLPKRDEAIKKTVRAGIIPRTKRVLSEIDFSGAEVITSSSYHRDPTFIAYLKDKSTDMHRDQALDIWQLGREELVNKKFTREQQGRAKKIRFYAKNLWTFAQFYGDWYDSCVRNLWETCIEREKLVLPSGVTLEAHCNSKGIFTMEDLIEHCKGVEYKLWNVKFPEYTRWKKNITEFYKKNGYIETFFGFRFIGLMDRKQCTNYPIQGTSFHLLLYTLIEVEKFIKKHNLKTIIIGQIHDSIISDVPVNEIEFYHRGVSAIISGLHKKFKWLTVEMEAECAISRAREDGGNFSELFAIDPDLLKGTSDFDVEKIYGKEA